MGHEWSRQQFLLTAAGAALASCQRNSSDSQLADSTLVVAPRRGYGEF
jgi:hypothetical protein